MQELELYVHDPCSSLKKAHSKNKVVNFLGLPSACSSCVGHQRLVKLMMQSVTLRLLAVTSDFVSDSSVGSTIHGKAPIELVQGANLRDP